MGKSLNWFTLTRADTCEKLVYYQHSSELIVLNSMDINSFPGECLIKAEPQHDKTNKMSVHPTKTQISLASTQSDQSLRCALNG